LLYQKYNTHSKTAYKTYTFLNKFIKKQKKPAF